MNRIDLQDRVLLAVIAGERTFGEIIRRVAQDCTAPISGMADALLVLVGQGRLTVDREGRLAPANIPDFPTGGAA